jgi:hypothetical protein
VAEEVAGPGGEFSILVSHHQVQMVGEDADGEYPHAGEALLRASEPFKDGVIEFAVGPKEESSLVAAGGN